MSSCCGHPHVALDRTKSSLKDAGRVVKSIIGTYKAEGTFGGIIFYKLTNCQNGASKSTFAFSFRFQADEGTGDQGGGLQAG